MTRKILLLFAVAIISLSAYPNKSLLFEYNRIQIKESFAKVDSMEKRIFVNLPGLETTQNFNLRDGDFDSPAFLLGCCLGPIGVAIILASDSDGKAGDAFKGFFGCLVPSAMFALGVYLEDPFLMHAAIDLAIAILDS